MTNLKVPFFKQLKKDSCGAAALGMVYNFFRVKHTQVDVWNRLSEPRKEAGGMFIGTNPILVDVAAQKLFYIAGHVVWQNERLAIGVLQGFISLGIPIIVCQRWKAELKLGHYKVVVGLDEYGVLVNDPEESMQRTRVSYTDFMEEWKQVPDSGEVVGGEFIAVFPGDLKEAVGKLEYSLLDKKIATNVPGLWKET